MPVMSDEELPRFAADVLTALGAEPTRDNVVILVTWMKREGSGAAFNPMGTTKLAGFWPGHPDSIFDTDAERRAASLSGDRPMTEYNDNVPPVMSYYDREQGVDRTAATLRDSFAAPILEHLMRPGGSTLNAVLADPAVIDPNEGVFAIWSGYEGGDEGYTTLEGIYEGHDVGTIVDTSFYGGPNAAGSETGGETGDDPFAALAGDPLPGWTGEGQFYEVPGVGGAPGAPMAATASQWYYAVTIGDEEPGMAGDGVAVYWEVTAPPPGTVATAVGRSDWVANVVGNDYWLSGGNEPITPRFNDAGMFLTPDEDALPINEVVRQLVVEASLAGTDALDYDDVLAVIAWVVADPERLTAIDYIKSQINLTEWAQGRNNLFANYETATAAEQRAMINRVLTDPQNGIYKQFQYYTSTFVDPDTELNVGGKTLHGWAEDIAMGRSTYWDVGNAIKSYADGMPGEYNNAWKIHKHDTTVAMGQYAVDFEAKKQLLEETYAKWGLDPEIYSWDVSDLATQLMNNEISMAEVMDDIRATASTKFPGKPDLLSTTEYAAPYVDVHNTEMESPVNASHPLGNSDIMLALQNQETPTDYRTRLRKKPEWQTSKRAKMITADTMRTMSDTFGFSGGGGIF